MEKYHALTEFYELQSLSVIPEDSGERSDGSESITQSRIFTADSNSSLDDSINDSLDGSVESYMEMMHTTKVPIPRKLCISFGHLLLLLDFKLVGNAGIE
jgi:hypothetical protein